MTAKFGLQPNGTIILENGQVWDPSTPLPADSTQAFNATPMGSPVNGLGTMAPTAVPPQAAPAAPPTTGMFAAKAPAPAPDPTQAAVPGIAMPSAVVPAPQPSFFQKGGTGGKIADGVSDFILNYAAAQGNPLGTAYLQSKQDNARQQAETQRAYVSKAQALQQYLMEQQWKLAHPEPGAIEKNANYLGTVDPRLRASYLNAEANPSQLVQDPSTGTARFVPKGMPMAKPAPTVGAVEQGYRYMGGDPANSSSWQKVS